MQSNGNPFVDRLMQWTYQILQCSSMTDGISGDIDEKALSSVARNSNGFGFGPTRGRQFDDLAEVAGKVQIPPTTNSTGRNNTQNLPTSFVSRSTLRTESSASRVNIQPDVSCRSHPCLSVNGLSDILSVRKKRTHAVSMACEHTSCEVHKRYRTSYTQDQLDKLEQMYRTEKYIGRPLRARLANELELPENTIKVWFQNRRMKEKRQAMMLPKMAGKDPYLREALLRVTQLYYTTRQTSSNYDANLPVGGLPSPSSTTFSVQHEMCPIYSSPDLQLPRLSHENDAKRVLAMDPAGIIIDSSCNGQLLGLDLPTVSNATDTHKDQDPLDPLRINNHAPEFYQSLPRMWNRVFHMSRDV